jgi:hypothetical protein
MREAEELPSAEAIARKRPVEAVIDCSHESVSVSGLYSVVPSSISGQ